MQCHYNYEAVNSICPFCHALGLILFPEQILKGRFKKNLDKFGAL